MQLLKAQDSFTTPPPPPSLPFCTTNMHLPSPKFQHNHQDCHYATFIWHQRYIYIYIYKQHKHLCHHQLHHQTYHAHSQQPISHLCVDSILLHSSTTNCTIVSTPLVQNTQLLLLHYHQSMLP